MGAKQQMVDARPLRDLVRLHDLSVRDISQRTGLSASALHQWIRDGKMPAYMTATCAGLLANLGHGPKRDKAAVASGAPDTPGATQVMVVRIPGTQRETVEKFLGAIGVQFQVIKDM